VEGVKMKIVVTGGAGFIGSHVTEALCDLDHEVIVIDDLSFGYKKFIDKRAVFVKGNIGDEKIIRQVLRGTDAVIHLAASSIIKFSYEDPISYFQNNLTNGIILLESMRKEGIKKIIYSSTAAVYGTPKKIPIKEDDPKNPISSYGASKLAFENALSAYYHAYGIESVSLRYFNAYGPRDEQKPATRAVPMWIKAILADKSVEVYWNAEQIRDYVFVKDIAQAHIDVLSKKGCLTYNIGSGKGIVMKDIIKEIEKIVGKRLKIINKDERKGDPHELIADISKIQKEIGWRPQISLAQGLRKTIEYYNTSSF
jgi:UDP-glucose 4-epimerase